MPRSVLIGRQGLVTRPVDVADHSISQFCGDRVWSDEHKEDYLGW